MGQNLTGSKIKDTYQWLLQVGNTAFGALRKVSLGNGTDSALSISDTAAEVDGDLEVTGEIANPRLDKAIVHDGSDNVDFVGDVTHGDQDVDIGDSSVNVRMLDESFGVRPKQNLVDYFDQGRRDLVDSSSVGKHAWRTGATTITPAYAVDGSDTGWMEGRIKLASAASAYNVCKLTHPFGVNGITDPYRLVAVGDLFTARLMLDDVSNLEFFFGFGDGDSLSTNRTSSGRYFYGVGYGGAQLTWVKYENGSTTSETNSGVTPSAMTWYEFKAIYTSLTNLQLTICDANGATLASTNLTVTDRDALAPVIYIRLKASASVRSMILSEIKFIPA